MLDGRLDFYGIPIKRRAYAVNGYHKNLDNTNSVLIYNNYLHNNSMWDIEMFAKRLYNLDRIIDVNVNAQKTPVLLQCDEQERLAMSNLYMQYDGNMPFIFGSKNLNAKGVTVLKTDAPYIADKVYQLKTQIWNEALTYLGISNINVVKKERLITNEADSNNELINMNLQALLIPRKEACKQFNEKYGLAGDKAIDVKVRSDLYNIVKQYESINGTSNTANISTCTSRRNDSC